MEPALLGAPALVGKVVLGAARVAVDPVIHEGVGGIQYVLDIGDAVRVLAAGDKVSREGKIVQDPVRVGPLTEQVIVLEKVIVTEGRVRDHQRLHRHGVFLHDVADAGARIDDDLVGEPLEPVPVERFLAGKALAEAPMPVHQRQTDRRIGIQHLLRGDHFDLIGINIEAEFVDRDLLDRVMHAPDLVEVPLRAFEQRPALECLDGSTHAACSRCLEKSSWKTGKICPGSATLRMAKFWYCGLIAS